MSTLVNARMTFLIQILLKGWVEIYRGWCRFFFEKDAASQMAVLRIFLGLVLLVAYSIRALDNEYYFGATGVLDLKKMMESFPMDFRYSLMFWFPSSVALKVFTGVFLLSLGSLTIGFFPRVSAAVAFVFHISFMHRNMAIVYGLDMIASYFLLALVISKTSSRPITSGSWAACLTSMGLRIVQIQICIIYAYSGWEKLKGAPWWRGEAIWSVFANTQITRWNMDWVSHFPIMITAATYATLLFEIYFPVLVWLRKWRPWILVTGVLLHLGIGFVVFIPFFSALMIFSYASFLTPTQARELLRRVKRRLPFLVIP